MPEAFAVDFHDHRPARAARVGSMNDLPGALVALGLSTRPTLVLVGGADRLTADDLEQLHGLFSDTVAPLVEELGTQVIDGGTDASVMQLIGRAREERQPGVADAVVPHMDGMQKDSRAEPLESSGLLVAADPAASGTSVRSALERLLGAGT